MWEEIDQIKPRKYFNSVVVIDNEIQSLHPEM